MRKFSTKLNGYDKEEVNRFVEEVAKNYEGMLNSLKERDNEVSLMNAKLNHYIEMETALNKALLVAEEASSQIKKLAKEESNILIEDAKKNASRIINNALLKAEKCEADADTLRRKINVYKKRVRQLLEEQIEMIEDIDDEI